MTSFAKRAVPQKENYITALQAMALGMSLQKASTIYNIPVPVLTKRAHLLQIERRKQEINTLLTEDEEMRLERWIVRCWRTRFTNCSESAICAMAFQLLKDSGRYTRSPDFNKRWFTHYCARHPNVKKVMVTSATQPSNWNFDYSQLREWYDTIKTYIVDHDLESVLQDDSRVYHCTQGKFETFSVVTAYSAAGTSLPPLVVLPIKSQKIRLPRIWSRYTQPNATIDNEVLRHYVQNVLHPALVQKKAKFPIVVFIDQPDQPPSMKLLEVCQKLNIVLINLYNLAFQKLRMSWTTHINEWFAAVPKHVHNKDFVDVLKFALTSCLSKQNIRKAFTESGIYPFSFSEVDSTYFTEGLKRNNTVDASTETQFSVQKNSVGTNTQRMDFGISLSEFKNIVGSSYIAYLDDFQNFDGSLIGSTHEFQCLFKIYKKLVTEYRNSLYNLN